MTATLVTCFEPYDEFPANASEIAMRLAREALESAADPAALNVHWEILPVDFDEAPRLLERLRQAQQFDHSIHIGQAPGADLVRIEVQAFNERYGPHDSEPSPLRAEPAAEDCYFSDLPLSDWVERLTATGLPTGLSHDAGRYLCNAVLYDSLHYAAQNNHPLHATFLHVPLVPEQTRDADGMPSSLPSLPVEVSADVIRHCIQFANARDK